MKTSQMLEGGTSHVRHPSPSIPLCSNVPGTLNLIISSIHLNPILFVIQVEVQPRLKVWTWKRPIFWTISDRFGWFSREHLQETVNPNRSNSRGLRHHNISTVHMSHYVNVFHGNSASFLTHGVLRPGCFVLSGWPHDFMNCHWLHVPIISPRSLSGWWFGTWILLFHILVKIISTD